MWLWKQNSSAAGQASMSIIDLGCEFEGRLTFRGTLILNGKVRGDVLTSDTLIVGETGELHANVQVGVAIISGQILGQVSARERVEIKRTAQINGDILTSVLELEKGVTFNGRCMMKHEELQVIDKTS